jgi:hypothetical protein
VKAGPPSVYIREAERMADTAHFLGPELELLEPEVLLGVAGVSATPRA